MTDQIPSEGSTAGRIEELEARLKLLTKKKNAAARKIRADQKRRERELEAENRKLKAMRYKLFILQEKVSKGAKDIALDAFSGGIIHN